MSEEGYVTSQTLYCIQDGYLNLLVSVREARHYEITAWTRSVYTEIYHELGRLRCHDKETTTTQYMLYNALLDGVLATDNFGTSLFVRRTRYLTPTVDDK